MKKWFILVVMFLASPLLAAFPTDDAVTLWHFDGLNDSNGTNSVLEIGGGNGKVQLGVPLSETEATESRLRGGDGKVARFQRGGFLNAKQGADGELNIGKNSLSIYLRLRLNLSEGANDCPIFAKRGEKCSYNLFAFRDFFGLEVNTTQNKQRLSGRAPFAEMRNPESALTAWHDVVVRMNEGKLEFFVDGRCVDEDFVLGDLWQNDEPVLIGAQTGENSVPDARFEGEIDTLAVWNRTLSEAEILQLSGGPERADSRSRVDRGNGESPQYWTPPNGYFVGDTFPFSHDGVFHAGYLLDKRHHGSKNGFGAHQWMQITSTDLIHWEHQPFIVPIEYQQEGSICTGSVFFHDGKYYAFYGNRWSKGFTENAREIPAEGLLSCSVSEDGIHFTKTLKPLFPTPEGYGFGTRDPVVFQNPLTKEFHLYATDSYKGRGCWLHAKSKDLKNWEILDPVYTDRSGQPECPDWFEWGGTYYVIAGHGNGFYRVSSNPDGPWEVPVRQNILMPGATKVPKTAAWKDGRRIITGWVGLGGWAGTLVFHELIRHEDGSLGEKFVPEMIPATEKPVVAETNVKDAEKTWENLPGNVRFQAEFAFEPARRDALLECKFVFAQDLELAVSPVQRAASIGGIRLEGLDFTKGTVTVDAILKDEVLDVCVNGEKTATFRVPKEETRSISFVNEFGSMELKSVQISPLK